MASAFTTSRRPTSCAIGWCATSCEPTRPTPASDALHVDVASEAGRVALSKARASEAALATLRAEKVRRALLSIAFVDEPAIAKLNRRHLGHRGPTDVISFGFARSRRSDPVVGDIYICADVARRNAAAHGTAVREELTRLIVHGVLHVLGHDHPVDARREHSAMWKRQERIVARLMRAQQRPRR